jgi:hypothetical protein
MAKKKKNAGNLFPAEQRQGTLDRQAPARIDRARKAYAFPFGAYSKNGTEPLRNIDKAKPKELNSSDWEQFDPVGSGVFMPTKGGHSDGVPILAISDGVIVHIGKIGNGSYSASYGNNNIVLKLDNPIKVNGKKYPYVFYGGCKKSDLFTSNDNPVRTAQVGVRVSKSEQIALSGKLGGKGSGLVIGLSAHKNGDPRGASIDVTKTLYDAMNAFLQSVDVETGFIPNTAAGYNAPVDPAINQPESGGNPLDNPGSIATAAAFSSYFQMPGMMETAEAIALTGRRSLMNDKPLLPFVEQIAGASLRSFMSMPNGNFYAFYPDYFGGLGRTAYWVINDVEILSGKIDLSDDNLATHVFVVGDTSASKDSPLGYGTVDWIDRINSAGVINVVNAFMADFLNGPPDDAKSDIADSTKPSLANKDAAINFLKKYGARPYYEEVPAVRSPIYETFLAYQRFCLLWASQFKTSFEFTFMPELFPGGLVELGDHGIQCYVEQVVHNGSYEEGFTTVATLSAPSAIKNDKTGKPVDPDRSWVHGGMIRAFQFDPNNPPGHPAHAYDATPSRPAPKKKGKK